MLVLVIIGLNIGEPLLLKRACFVLWELFVFLRQGAQMFVPDDEYDMRVVAQDFGDAT